MSVVGNFSFQNYDRSAGQGGVGNKLAERTQSSQLQDTDEQEEFFTPLERRQSEVVQLARQLTKHSINQNQNAGDNLRRTQSGGSTIVGDGDAQGLLNYEEGSDLDPYSDNFDIRKWTNRAVRASKDPQRTSGIAYRNLDVHGFGSDAGTFLVTSKSKVIVY